MGGGGQVEVGSGVKAWQAVQGEGGRGKPTSTFLSILILGGEGSLILSISSLMGRMLLNYSLGGEAFESDSGEKGRVPPGREAFSDRGHSLLPALCYLGWGRHCSEAMGRWGWKEGYLCCLL